MVNGSSRNNVPWVEDHDVTRMSERRMADFQLLLQAMRNCRLRCSYCDGVVIFCLCTTHPFGLTAPLVTRTSKIIRFDGLGAAPRRRHWGGTVSPRGGGSPQRVWGFASTSHTGALGPLAKSRLKVSKRLAQATIANFRTWDGSEGVGVDPLPGRDAPNACGMADPLCEGPLASRRRVVASQTRSRTECPFTPKQ